MKKKCVFVDVFTDVAYAGNGLAVFPDASGLSSSQMQRLANEINYSETTFIVGRGGPEADFDIRIFTPANELPFAGHPVLGTAFAILELFESWPASRSGLRLRTKAGVIPLEKRGQALWMTQNEPVFLRQHGSTDEIASMVNLDASDIRADLPAEEVSTGNRVLIVPVKSLDAMSRARGNAAQMAALLDDGVLGPYLFSLETTDPGKAVHTRFFAPHLGIIEDPATGSAAGPLVGYLLKHRIFGERFEIENEQGVEMGRPSRILMRGAVEDGRYCVEIGGTCCSVGDAEFEI